MALIVIEGCGDIGSAIAHQIFKVSQSVLVTDNSRPAHSRRGMIMMTGDKGKHFNA